MTPRQYRAARKRIWEDMTGCTCKRTIVVNGETIMLGLDEICTRAAIRCNGRMVRWSKDSVALGPDPSLASLPVRDERRKTA